MKCFQCGAETKTARENFKYEASGLPGVTLVGVEVSRCPSCGEYEVAIPSIEQLHKVMALAVARKRAKLTPAEVRYLRKWLGWSGTDFAARMGVTPESVSRWETGALAMGGTADRLLRMMVLSTQPVADYSLDLMKEVAQEEAAPIRLGMRADEKGWHTEAA